MKNILLELLPSIIDLSIFISVLNVHKVAQYYKDDGNYDSNDYDDNIESEVGLLSYISIYLSIRVKCT